ncbi:D-aminopeptidase [Cystobacter fuscus]|uniref:D-aminopeptidase n=1 Tax=Cystobacter fuscus TaxID=43 RepID=A0A250J3D9_9BACT|nr:P1 family peptidase [Cystobacter fuscus]ATB38474.1 D-aminopeptidase [Cystobacter fuscus]
MGYLPESETPEKRVRARELGLPLGRFKPGRHNAITDVEGVLVGHSTIIQGEGPLRPGHGPVRTGVTAILPNRRDIFMERMTGGGFVLNGAGEVSGMTQLMEWGLVETPILLTNTMAVGAVSDAVTRHMVEQNPGIGDEHDVIIPIVGECDDSYLNDISGRHVKREHVYEAIRTASDGPVAEGNVGGGTGMLTCDFKGGIGTSSRKLPESLGGYTLGVLVMSNFGKMHNLRVGGLPVGELLAEKFKHMPRRTQNYGSIISVVATDAPLLTNQINRLCKRVALGIGRVGSYAAHGSGEIVVGFSTANVIPRRTQKMVYKLKILLDQRLDPLYEAVMEATEEAILNAMCMATSMTGVNGNFVPALPLDEVRRFVSACQPIFSSVKKRAQQAGTPGGKGKPAEGDKPEHAKLRGAEGIPYPTRPAPEVEPGRDIEDSSSKKSSDT